MILELWHSRLRWPRRIERNATYRYRRFRRVATSSARSRLVRVDVETMAPRFAKDGNIVDEGVCPAVANRLKYREVTITGHKVGSLLLAARYT